MREEIYQYMEDHMDELIDLVCDLIQIPSENPTGSQREVVDYVENYLKEIGISFKEVGENPKHPNIIAKIGNEEGYQLGWNGHLDVVPAGDLNQWKWDPFSAEVTDTQILGRGTSDMKAGVAGLLFATRILKEWNVNMHGGITMHIVSDEESGSEYGTKWLAKNGYFKGLHGVIIGEPTSNWTIETGQKGQLHIELVASGVCAHGSLAQYKGDNAILKLSRVLHKLDGLTQIKGNIPEDLLDAYKQSVWVDNKEIGVDGAGEVLGHVSCNVGVIVGGSAANVVPDSCKATIDCRLPYGVNHQEIIDFLDSIMEEGVTYSLDWISEASITRNDCDLVKSLQKNAEDVWNIDVYPAWQWACSDARLYRLSGIDTLQYGPSNTEGIHAPNENVDIEDVKNAARVYLRTFCDVLEVK